MKKVIKDNLEEVNGGFNSGYSQNEISNHMGDVLDLYGVKRTLNTNKKVIIKCNYENRYYVGTLKEAYESKVDGSMMFMFNIEDNSYMQANSKNFVFFNYV